MSWITTLHPEQATGAVADVYAAAQAAWGMIPNALRALSSSPAALTEHWRFIQNCMQHPNLSAEFQTWLRLLTSQQAHCRYCIDANAGMLIEFHKRTPEEVARGRADPGALPLPDRERALLAFALRAVGAAGPADAQEIAALRAAGWSDGDLLDAALMATRQADIDALLNLLGVEADHP